MKQMSPRAGFTLVEMLVASLLLGMLVTILTMVFNASSIAWRTGKAGVSQLSLIRRNASFAQKRSENLLPRVDENSPSTVGLVTGAWAKDGKVRTRAVARYGNDGGFTLPNFNSYDSAKESDLSSTPAWQAINNLQSIQMGSAKSYTVGVLSYGPDGRPNSGDEITTWPNEVE